MDEIYKYIVGTLIATVVTVGITFIANKYFTKIWKEKRQTNWKIEATHLTLMNFEASALSMEERYKLHYKRLSKGNGIEN